MKIKILSKNQRGEVCLVRGLDAKFYLKAREGHHRQSDLNKERHPEKMNSKPSMMEDDLQGGVSDPRDR